MQALEHGGRGPAPPGNGRLSLALGDSDVRHLHFVARAAPFFHTAASDLWAIGNDPGGFPVEFVLCLLSNSLAVLPRSQTTRKGTDPSEQCCS